MCECMKCMSFSSFSKRQHPYDISTWRYSTTLCLVTTIMNARTTEFFLSLFSRSKYEFTFHDRTKNDWMKQRERTSRQSWINLQIPFVVFSRCNSIYPILKLFSIKNLFNFFFEYIHLLGYSAQDEWEVILLIATKWKVYSYYVPSSFMWKITKPNFLWDA